MNPKQFLVELKRRNVYKVAAAYAIIGWLIIQVATQVFPFFEIPNWAVRLVVLLIVVGFPIALVIAWAFEITPEGFKRAEDVDPGQKHTRGGAWIYIVLVGAALSIGLFFLGRYTAPGSDGSVAAEKSIAVLPFENYSDDKADTFFANGIQDDILTSLAKIRDLKVISRTSVMGYRGGEARNLRDIARSLGVTNVLEGSVRRVSNRVLVNVQLIDALNDRHIWADRYDRTMEDVISLQGQLATEIASALRATLSPQEKARVETKPTTSPDAYTLYLKGLELEMSPDVSPGLFKEIEESYVKAVALDPKFALARARLSSAIANVYHEFEPTEDRKRRARVEAEAALRLDPDLGEAHVALAHWYYWIEGDYETALQELAVAARTLPNSSDVPMTTAAIRRRQGRWRDALTEFNRAQTVDPRNGGIMQETVFTYLMLRDWPASKATVDRLLGLAPSSPTATMMRAYVEFFETGDIAAAEAILERLPAGDGPDGGNALVRWEFAMLRRDFDRAAQLLAGLTSREFPVPSGPPIPRSYLEGCIAFARGDIPGSRGPFQQAAGDLEKYVRESPEDASRHSALGLTYAFLGRKDDAIREGRRALELKPESKDALLGAQFAAVRALIYTLTGDTDQATELLERLITTPAAVGFSDASVTLHDLQLRWQWDPLRKNARFQKLAAGPERETVY